MERDLSISELRLSIDQGNSNASVQSIENHNHPMHDRNVSVEQIDRNRIPSHIIQASHSSDSGVSTSGGHSETSQRRPTLVSRLSYLGLNNTFTFRRHTFVDPLSDPSQEFDLYPDTAEDPLIIDRNPLFSGQSTQFIPTENAQEQNNNQIDHFPTESSQSHGQEPLGHQTSLSINPVKRWIHSSREGKMVTLFGIFIFLATFIPALLTTNIPGYSIDPGLVFGSIATLILCSIIIVTYFGVQKFVVHPNPVIMAKCGVDLLVAYRFLLDPFFNNIGVYSLTDEDSCWVLSGVTEFLFFASDAWYFALIVDLYISLTNPFAGVESNRRMYYIGVSGASFLSALVTMIVPGWAGFAEGNYCWTKRLRSRNLFAPNYATWTVFYFWIYLIYMAGFVVLIFSTRRLRAGLKNSLRTRQEMLRNGKASIMGYTCFWILALVWYAVSFTQVTQYQSREKGGKMTPSSMFRSYAYTIAGRGVVNFFVWFQINSPSIIRKSWMRFTDDSVDQKFSAQLNRALQKEVIQLTIRGMTKAIRDADNEYHSTRNHHNKYTTSPKSNTVQQQQSENMAEEVNQTIRMNSQILSSLSNNNSDYDNENSRSGIGSVPYPLLSGQSPTHPDRGRPGSVQSIGASSATHSQTSSTTNNKIKCYSYKSNSFARLRYERGVLADDFRKSFRNSTMPNISEGASGAFMFFSGDRKYIVKSMDKRECRFLIQIADQYCDYLVKNPGSHLTKFFGCFVITLYDKNFYFVVMENLFAGSVAGALNVNKKPTIQVHHRYDLKGSWVDRSYKRPHRGAKVKCRHCSMLFRYRGKQRAMCPNIVGPHEPNVVLKDNDLRTRMRIGDDEGLELYLTLRADSRFLCDLGIMDYSLLLGVMDIEFLVDQQPVREDRAHSSESYPSRLNQTSLGATETDSNPSFISATSTIDHIENSSGDSFHSYLGDSVANNPYGNSMPNRSHVNSHRGSDGEDPLRNSRVIQQFDDGDEELDVNSLLSENRSLKRSERVFGPGFYYVGIIDILQQWTWQKKLERMWKVEFKQCDPNGVSAMEPVAYQKRFEKKLREIIAVPKEYFNMDHEKFMARRMERKAEHSFVLSERDIDLAIFSNRGGKHDDIDIDSPDEGEIAHFEQAGRIHPHRLMSFTHSTSDPFAAPASMAKDSASNMAHVEVKTEK